MTYEEDVEVFKRLSEELKSQHQGKFVLIKDGTNCGIFSNYEDAHREALEKFGVSEVVIAQIGTAVPVNYLASATVA